VSYPARPRAARARIVVAEHDRLVVTYSRRDDIAYLLCPPGEDPLTVLAAAGLVLPDDVYRELAGRLGVAAGGAWSHECAEPRRAG
jgi:hypothetical protein